MDFWICVSAVLVLALSSSSFFFPTFESFFELEELDVACVFDVYKRDADALLAVAFIYDDMICDYMIYMLCICVGEDVYMWMWLLVFSTVACVRS
jgi:hypothetical protein